MILAAALVGDDPTLFVGLNDDDIARLGRSGATVLDLSVTKDVRANRMLLLHRSTDQEIVTLFERSGMMPPGSADQLLAAHRDHDAGSQGMFVRDPGVGWKTQGIGPYEGDPAVHLEPQDPQD